MPSHRFENLDTDRRTAILDAAKAEFVANGFDGASLNTILKTSGFSKGSFYYYFNDKADLYATVVQRILAPYYERLGEVCAVDTPQAYWREFEQYTMEMAESFIHDPELIQLSLGMMKFRMAHSTPQVLIDLYDLAKNNIASLVVRGRDAGAVTTDMPDDLLVDLWNNLGETLDFWTFEHIEELMQADFEWHMKLFVKLFKSIAELKIQP